MTKKCIDFIARRTSQQTELNAISLRHFSTLSEISPLTLTGEKRQLIKTTQHRKTSFFFINKYKYHQTPVYPEVSE